MLAPRILALGIALGTAPTASALNPVLDVSQYAHTSWIFRDGFAPGRVTSIAQTTDGYLWLGTEFGLLRFDGVRSVPWRPSDGEQLPNSWIRSLLATDDGTLWIGTLQGLASWKSGKLTRYPQLEGHSVNTLVADRRGTVWAGGYAGPQGSLCAIANGRVDCEENRFGQWVGSLYEDRAGVLWATAQTGLWRWRPGAPTHYALPGPAVGSSQALHQHADGRLVVVAQDGLRQLVEGRSTAFPLPDARLESKPDRLLRDRDGGLWIGTVDGGLLHVRQGRTDVYTQAHGLSGDFVTRLFEDREGNIWVATTNGLDRFRNLSVRTISATQGLPSAPPWSVLAARDGSVWLGTMDGLSRWDRGRVTTYRTPARAGAGVHASDRAGARHEVFDSGLPDNGVGTLFEDRDGRLWVSTLHGVAYFEHGRFVPVTQLPQGRTSAIAGDDIGNLWVLNDAHGLYRMFGGIVAEHLPWTAFGPGQPATALLPDRVHGGVWVGLRDRVVHVQNGAIRASYLAATGRTSGRVNDLRFDTDGALWIATERGLSRIKHGRTLTLTASNGLPCDAVHWSVQDDDGSVWLYLPCGLIRIGSAELNAALDDPARRIQAAVFDSSDGVALRVLPPLYRPQVARTTDGQLWFLPGDGVSVLDPRRLASNPIPPPVHIEQVTADRSTYAPRSGLRLPPLIRDLAIDYTALSFVAPEKNRFRVKLDGRDANWQEVGNRRQALYADLPPGSYRFRVAAANNSGVWNESGAVLDFTIAPAYYQTPAFRAAFALMVLGLFLVLYRLRLRQIARTLELRLDERVNERTRIARELHDTLLQSFQGLMLRFQSARDLLPADPLKAADAFDGALNRADQAIVEGRDAIQNLRSSTAAVTELAEAFTALAEDFSRGVSGERRLVTFGASVEGKPRELNPLLRDDVYRIAAEALRNAYRHGHATRIEAEVTYGLRHLRVRIRDDGRGIDPAFLTAGPAGHWGLTTMRERARQIGSQLSLWSEAGAGTEVELLVPGSVAYCARRRRDVLWRVLSREEAYER